jgi:phosphatidylinositol phospholipase C delta
VRDICQAIDKYAFVTSPYPVIISAEVHCSIEQQTQLNNILRTVFGDKLVSHPIDEDGGPGAPLPSPEQLRNRILFKTKPPPPEMPTRQRIPSFSESATSSTESESGFARLARKLSIGSPSEKKPVFSPALTDLLVYTAGVKYQGFSKLVTYEPRHQFSVSERTGSKMLKENKADWIKHNYTHLSRVYPKASRVDSTNYDPLPFWQAGCQLVALNFQTHGELDI